MDTYKNINEFSWNNFYMSHLNHHSEMASGRPAFSALQTDDLYRVVQNNEAIGHCASIYKVPDISQSNVETCLTCVLVIIFVKN